MGIDLKKLKEKQLKQFSYQDILEVIDELEKINVSNYSGRKSIEDIEQFISFLIIIKTRIENNDISELKDDDRKVEKTALKNRVTTVLTNFKYAYYIFVLDNRISQVETFSTQASKIQSKISSLEEEYKKKNADIDKIVQGYEERIKDSEKRIDESEPKILSHVLSIMGVFSAIITIILSLVITSSSWLNNADGASAIIAFVVPNLVALLVVFVLLSLVFFYLHKDTNEKSEKCAKQKRSRAFTITIVGILICAGLCCWLCLSKSIENPLSHVRYIISPDQYEVVEDSETSSDNCPHNAECDCHTKIGIKKYFEITFENKKYRFEYDKDLVHDGNLYFCQKHEVLE